MKTHDLLQRKKGIKPAPDLVLEGVEWCMKINMLIKKSAGSASARARAEACVFLVKKRQDRNIFLMG